MCGQTRSPLLTPRRRLDWQISWDAAEGSLFQLMASEGLHPYLAEQKFNAGSATEREAELLRIQPGDVGIRMSCTAFDETGGPIEYTESFIPGGLYEFQLTLRVK